MGEILMAIKATHVPSMLISEMPGENHGCRQAAIDAEREIGRRAAALGVDTFIVFDTHWLVNAGYHINNNAVHKGNYTSHEFPHFIQDLPYEFPGNPELGAMIAEEATAISAAIPEKSVLVALDERGDNVDSAAFARHLGRWRDDQVANTIFTIGGADGLSPDLRRKAKLRIAFGSATWPHQMVRVMLLEQIYRAATILAGHPYHRA